MPDPARKATPRARKPRPAAKQVVVPYWVEISSDMLPASARQAFNLVTSSWDGFRTHAYDIQGVGVDPDVRIARFDHRFRLIYRETPAQVNVTMIVSEGAI